MFAAKRLEIMMKIIEAKGSINVNQISSELAVTAKTVRKDLAKLEKMGLLKRVHGGAVLRPNGNSVFPIAERKLKYIDYKQHIANAALKYIQEGDAIIIDGGSTTLELAKRLGDKRITAIANDLRIIWELTDKENIELYVLGGKLRRENIFNFIGPGAVKTMTGYYANKLFLATSALDFAGGLMVLSLEEADLKRAMIRAAQEVICLCDYSKFHHVALVSFGLLEKIDRLITDERITEEDKLYLENKGIIVEIAK